MNFQWWKEAICYQIYPKSFYDSNGDGIGDLQGIIEKLDYIKDLGVNVIWLCPVYKSPMDDNGYDISDFYHIDPQFGTDDDMDKLIFEADKRGMKILMDLVINHTSDEHEWFEKALEDPNSKYADYYIFREGKDGNPPNNWRSYFGGSAWEQIGNSNRYYLHAFSKKQPDLNWEISELREELYEMVNFWLDKGLAGFRVDAICNIKKTFCDGIFPTDGEDGLCFIGNWILNQEGIEEFLTGLNEKTFKPHNSMTVAESDVPKELLEKFIGEDGYFSMVFDFSYTDLDVPSTGEWFKPVNWSVREMRDKIFQSQLETQKIGWGAVYLENHDQPRSLNKYIPSDDIGFESATMLATMYFLLRGTPFIYQGQELGMSNCRMDSMSEYDDIATHDQYHRAILSGLSEQQAMEQMYRRSRDNSRTPFQWDHTKNGGFSTGNPWLKVNDNYTSTNVNQQIQDSTSVWSYYKMLIDLRNDSEYRKAIIYGEFLPCYTQYDSIVAYKRVTNEASVLIISNFSSQDCEVTIEEDVKGQILSNYEGQSYRGDLYNFRPYESVVFAL
ncbi:alpha-glucosidase [Peribacillus muralis]|uniref:alpha-glucosidase n=1 Tax=Peribacillus muralis TaxID=264697 RepID=UPI001F4DA983|nr:alpha-glucosidase [Peribacillus muralis]MCK1991049.1 alpha-glucosidase [Peribacillus muralis]MCK2011603.1 alpha-glucosidase [Peribacillus muralis]